MWLNILTPANIMLLDIPLIRNIIQILQFKFNGIKKNDALKQVQKDEKRNENQRRYKNATGNHICLPELCT
jgi:uncharacterized protein YqhQ